MKKKIFKITSCHWLKGFAATPRTNKSSSSYSRNSKMRLCVQILRQHWLWILRADKQPTWLENWITICYQTMFQLWRAFTFVPKSCNRCTHGKPKPQSILAFIECRPIIHFASWVWNAWRVSRAGWHFGIDQSTMICVWRVAKGAANNDNPFPPHRRRTTVSDSRESLPFSA